MTQREEFEEWFKHDFHPDKTGPYIIDQLFFAWKAFLVLTKRGAKNLVSFLTTAH